MSKAEPTEEVEVLAPPPAQPMKKSRDSLRAEIFSAKYTKPKTINYTFNGVDLEWRQPTINAIQTARAEADEDANFMTTMIIEYSFIEGTNDRIFEEADRESLENMPFGGQWQNTLMKISEALDLNVEEKAKN